MVRGALIMHSCCLAVLAVVVGIFTTATTAASAAFVPSSRSRSIVVTSSSSPSSSLISVDERTRRRIAVSSSQGTTRTTASFLSLPPTTKTTTTTTTTLDALTERQMQFWEDVEEGLNDIEEVYAKKGQDIDRIRLFGKSARGEIPAPKGTVPGHEPSEEHVDGLTAQPFWDVINDSNNYFPWASELENKSYIIMEEFENKLQRDAQEKDEDEKNNNKLFTGDSAWQNQVMGNGWSAFRLQRLGVWNTKNCEQFPKTYELLRSLNIPLAVRGVCFARQAPGSGVQPHSDGRNFILTSHLGLKVPEGCWIQVGKNDENNEQRQSWSEGKLTTIDTSFIHSTGNPNTNKERHVLIIDFWHPELTEGEIAALEYVYDLRNKYESGMIPVRTPKSVVLEQKRKKEEEEESGAGGGLAGMWNALTGGGAGGGGDD